MVHRVTYLRDPAGALNSATEPSSLCISRSKVGYSRRSLRQFLRAPAYKRAGVSPLHRAYDECNCHNHSELGCGPVPPRSRTCD